MLYVGGKFSIHYLDILGDNSSNFQNNLSNSLQNIWVSINLCSDLHNNVTAVLLSTVNVRVENSHVRFDIFIAL